MKKEVRYLGQIISEDSVRPDIGKINIKKLTQIPKTHKQLKSLIGYCNWFRPYIKNLSLFLAPLNEKLKEKEITWSEDDSARIKTIKETIENQPTLLHLPELDKPYKLFTDASNIGLGAILTQDNKIIKIWSRKLSKAQTNYSILERELLAIVLALEEFKTIIFDNHVTIFTDNRNITFNTSMENARVQRWKIALNRFNYEIKHRAATENMGADMLSRNFIIKRPNNILSLNEIHKEQKENFNEKKTMNIKLN